MMQTEDKLNKMLFIPHQGLKRYIAGISQRPEINGNFSLITQNMKNSTFTKSIIQFRCIVSSTQLIVKLIPKKFSFSSTSKITVLRKDGETLPHLRKKNHITRTYFCLYITR